MKKLQLLFLVMSAVANTVYGALASTQPEINWQPYGDNVFTAAKKDHKLIILELHAVWCHWCHV